MRVERCAVWVWYLGGPFAGFQTQPGARTVQSELQRALVAAGSTDVAMPSGRTDKGVHARMQVVSARMPAQVTEEAFADRLRALLSKEELGIVALHRPVSSFHAQWSAVRKEYRYRFALGRQAPAAWTPFTWQVDAAPEKLAEALSRAVGTRDFSAFHLKSSVRRERSLEAATLHELGDGIFEARFVGDSFARHQVRYLAGAAVDVATGALSEEAYGAALDRAEALRATRAPSQGLVLWEVGYPKEVDPFSALERQSAPDLPHQPPYYWDS